LSGNPFQGTKLAENTYKIRMAVASKAKGKSAGVRIITYLVLDNQEVILLTIYDKSEISTVSDHEIKNLLTNIL